LREAVERLEGHSRTGSKDVALSLLGRAEAFVARAPSTHCAEQARDLEKTIMEFLRRL